MDINASTVSQAYTAAKPVVAGTQGTAQSGQTSQTFQSNQTNSPAVASAPAVTLDLSPHVLKVEAFADLSAQDRQELMRRKQEILDHATEIARAHGNEPDFSGLEGKDINFSWGDGTIKTWRADGYVVTSTYDAQQKEALQSYNTAQAAALDAQMRELAEQSTARVTAAVPKAPPPPAEPTDQPASTAEPAQATPPKTSQYSHLPSYKEVKLSDLSTEEQQSLLQLREQSKAMLAVFGETLDRAVSRTTQSGLTTVLTTDDRVFTYQQDIRYRLTPEQIAERRAADEQQQRETEAQMAAQEEWGKKWGLGAKVWTGPMSASERGAAEEVATTEHALRLTRLNISYANGMVYTIAHKEKELSAVEPGDAGSAAARKLNEELTAARAQLDEMVRGFREEQQRFATAYGFQLKGDLVEQGADGRFREGTYTLNKSGSGWALRVDSADGMMVSINGQPFSHDFKRVVVRDLGPSPILTESPEERAQRVAPTD